MPCWATDSAKNRLARTGMRSWIDVYSGRPFGTPPREGDPKFEALLKKDL